MSPQPKTNRVLVIDDDQKLCRLIQEYLESLDYTVEFVHSGPAGAVKAVREKWSAVILDVMLPGMDGFEVLKKIRQSSSVPVLMLTARGGEDDRIAGLDGGADDYLPKTFSTRELLARLNAVIRRAEAAAAPSGKKTKKITVGPLVIDPSIRAVFLNQKELVLTSVEFDLLWGLALCHGKIKTRESLLEECRERRYEVFDRSIDMHISSLRKKLGDSPANPRFIKTVRSAGYILMNPGRTRP